MVDQPNAKLRVIAGPQGGKASELLGGVFELTAGEVIIGRDPAADIAIPEKVVSRRHARLTQKSGAYYGRPGQAATALF
jgi:pSer/pThr/pTyr-binding forkhead associated (FHA) protein